MYDALAVHADDRRDLLPRRTLAGLPARSQALRRARRLGSGRSGQVAQRPRAVTRFPPICAIRRRQLCFAGNPRARWGR